MSSYIVAYDLYQSGQNYQCLINKLKEYPTRWHMQRSVWIIETSETAVQVRDKLSACLDSNDKLYVGKLAGEAAWTGYSDEVSRWIKERV